MCIIIKFNFKNFFYNKKDIKILVTTCSNVLIICYNNSKNNTKKENIYQSIIETLEEYMYKLYEKMCIRDRYVTNVDIKYFGVIGSLDKSKNFIIGLVEL